MSGPTFPLVPAAGLLGIGFAALMLWWLHYDTGIVGDWDGWVGIVFAATGQITFQLAALFLVARRRKAGAR